MRASGVEPRIVKTHSDVLACAWTLLLEQGWESVTVSNVAERSGYARSTLCRHWPNRLDLLSEAISEQVRSSHTMPPGHTRNDLIAELEAFQNAITSAGLGPMLAAITHLAGNDFGSATMAQALWVDEARVLSSILLSARANGAAMEQRLRCRQPDLSSAPNRSEPPAKHAEWGRWR